MTRQFAADILPTASENGVFSTPKIFSKDYKALFVTTARVIVQQQFEFVYLQFLLIHFQRRTA